MNRNRAGAAKPRAWYQIKNSAGADLPAEVLIYDEIDSWFGISADSFVRELATIDASEIVVRINSPGGSVHDGIAILNALRGHSAKITTVVDGLAASAASFIAMAGDEVIMRPNAEMMIHNPWTVAAGNADELRKWADNLDRLAENTASIYASRAGGDIADWRAAMNAETWYSADEAVDAGLADRVELPAKESTASARAQARFDLSIFTFAGRRAAPAPGLLAAINPQSSSAPPEATPPRKEAAMALSDDLREALGIEDTAITDEALLAKVAELAAGASEPAEADAGPEPDPEPGPAAKLPDGIVAIDRDQLEALKASAARGEAARARQEADDRERIVDSAIRAGRIAPAKRAAWVNRLKADPGEADTLASLEPVFSVTETGHGLQPEPVVPDDLGWFDTVQKGN